MRSHLSRSRPAGQLQIALATLALLATHAPALAGDWLQWRGPTRDGISTESGWTTAWPASGPKVLWKQSFGIGCSSFTVAGNRAYTMGNEKDTDTVFCIDVVSGKILWRYSYPSALDPNMFEGGPCGTPAIDGPRIYTLSRHGLLLCLEEGKVIWSKDLIKDFGAKKPTWGYASSPLVLGGHLLLDVGGKGSSSVALDKLTGKVVWQSGDDPASYGSPIIVKSGPDTTVAFMNARALVVRAARDGRELWRFPWKTQYDVNAATPIIIGDDIFISSGYGHGGALVRPAANGASAVWESKSMRNQVNSSVLWEGHLYGFDESSLNCLEAATGAVKWKQGGLGKGSLTIADGKLLIMSENGKLVVASPSPQKFQRVAEAQVLSKERCWVVPTLAHGRIFCKNNSGEAVALDVSAN
jgi:outer membrane protein assembly factor BamB